MVSSQSHLALSLGAIHTAAYRRQWKYSDSITPFNPLIDYIPPAYHDKAPPLAGSLTPHFVHQMLMILPPNVYFIYPIHAIGPTTSFWDFIFSTVLASFQPVYCTRPSKTNGTASMVQIEAKVLLFSGTAFVTSPMFYHSQLLPTVASPPATSPAQHTGFCSLVQQCLFATGIHFTIP